MVLKEQLIKVFVQNEHIHTGKTMHILEEVLFKMSMEVKNCQAGRNNISLFILGLYNQTRKILKIIPKISTQKSTNQRIKNFLVGTLD